MKQHGNPDIDSVRGTHRIINFSDAVFAVAITLLVVQIPIPLKASTQELGDDLAEGIPMLFSFAISFGVIAMLWLKHLHFNNHVKRYSVGLIWANFLFLLIVAFLPYPTGVYGTHSSDETAQIFYAVSVAIAGYAAAMMWLIAIRQPDLFHEDVEMEEARHSARVSFVMPTGFAVSIIFSYLFPPIVPYVWIGFAAVSPFLRKL
ncbi:MAG: TMEM175 family protein [Thermoleophilia bacterium]|nr:TMEM175 family protein [Thermoleophilia bacterium]